MVCFGEALWDLLPRGLFLGGAPLNVAYHLSRQGVNAVPVSAIGCDFLGAEAMQRIGAWGIETRGVARLARKATGTVRASLDGRGIASYRIERDVAWDRIPLPRRTVVRAEPAVIVYGTLALRNRFNRETLARLLARWPRALRVLDINLRPPFDRGTGVAFALRHSQVVKLNDTELRQLTGLPVGTVTQLENAARQFASRHALARVCVTAGARGAGLWWDGVWYWEKGRRVVVRDTVGSGDAFLGAFLAAGVRGAAPRDALACACRLGEFVAERDGATPDYRCDARGRPYTTAS